MHYFVLDDRHRYGYDQTKRKKKALHTFHRGIPVRKCTFRWLSHKRHRFGNRTHYDNRDHKCTRDKVDGNGTQRSQAGKYTRQSRDGICKKKKNHRSLK